MTYEWYTDFLHFKSLWYTDLVCPFLRNSCRFEKNTEIHKDMKMGYYRNGHKEKKHRYIDRFENKILSL